MIYGEELLERLAQLPPVAWDGVVFRHMFGMNSPQKENIVGARWNPPDVPAIYTSLEPGTAKAEGDYQIAMQPITPKADRRIHRIQVSLEKVLDLRDWSLLEELGMDQISFSAPEPARCKEVGGAIKHLGFDGVIVPSARSEGSNLVIFPDNKTATYKFEPIESVVV